MSNQLVSALNSTLELPYAYILIFYNLSFLSKLPKSFNCALSVIFKLTKWGVLSSESGASCLRASFSMGVGAKFLWGKLSCFFMLLYLSIFRKILISDGVLLAGPISYSRLPLGNEIWLLK